MALALLHIGMMRAGSTWLHKWLAAHPELASPWPSLDPFAPKNPYFWNRNNPLGRPTHRADRPVLAATIEEYRTLAGSAPKVIDVTDSASFMTCEEIAAFRAECPDTLVSYVRRDPIDALWSHMRLHRIGVSDLPDYPRLLANVRSDENLARWRAEGIVPHIIEFEQIRHDPLLVLRGLACRLGIDPDWWTPYSAEVAQRVNARPAVPIAVEVREQLEGVL